MKSNPAHSSNKDIIRKLLRFGLAAIFIGLIGYFAIVGTFPAFSLRYLGEENWGLLGDYASVISLALLLGGLAFAFAEYTDKENARYREKLVEEREKAKLSYDIYQAIFEKLTAPEQEAARRWILANITLKKDAEDIAAWYEETHKKIMARQAGITDGVPEGQNSVKLTLNCFDYIGFIANHYWDIDEDSLDWISPPIAKVWKRIGPYVAHVRTLRKAKDYYLSAEDFGKRCIQWRKDRGLPDEEYAKETL
ncbi:MAG: hypothetical protein EHM33_00575 [Chloroflexi bacterium]|nr:MAG: hypothetical protein EHM33_00575 [Chloroflexota bacterium]